MLRKRTRSRTGSFGSSAIASTLSSNSSLESSRLMYRVLGVGRTGKASGSGRAPTATDELYRLLSGPRSRIEKSLVAGLWWVSRLRTVAAAQRPGALPDWCPQPAARADQAPRAATTLEKTLL